mmetsp:Transcript_31809/g.62547  ORF Transcript_31809/g.62547 Transcript_31809/m.62547 type:complete len:499 (+) Transcript_31809:614-2110(+)
MATVRFQVGPQPVWEEDGIRVGLDSPVTSPVAPIPADCLPHVHEQSSVGSCAILADANRHCSEVDRPEFAKRSVSQVRVWVAAEDCIVVACKDTDAFPQCVAHQVCLLVIEPEDGDAEERWGVPGTRGTGAELLAHPGLLGLRINHLAVDAPLLPLGAAGQAARPVFVPLVALHAALLAALRLEAIFCIALGALFLHPGCDFHRVGRRCAGCATSKRRAVPGVTVLVVCVRAWVATDQALGGVAILPETLHSGLCAAPGFRTILAILGTFLRHPWGRFWGIPRPAGRTHAQLLALPGAAGRVHRVRAWGATGFAAGPFCVFLETSVARILAAPRLCAVLPWAGACLCHPRRHHWGRRWAVVTGLPRPQSLALPGLVVHVRGIGARPAGGSADRPLGVLCEALSAGLRAALRVQATLTRMRAAALVLLFLLCHAVQLCHWVPHCISWAAKHEHEDCDCQQADHKEAGGAEAASPASDCDFASTQQQRLSLLGTCNILDV